MSGDGGDSGGGGGGGEGGGGGKGTTKGSGGSETPVPTFSEGPPAGGGSLPFSSPGTSAGEQAGFQGSGALPPEITTGNSGGNSPDMTQWGAPQLSDFISDTSGFNLAGPGPAGGGSGPAAVNGGVFSTDSSATSLPQDSNPLGTTAPSAGGSGSAAAFAAPEGVSGSPQLDSLVSAPSGGGAGTGVSPSDQSVFDSLNGAQHAAADQYATTSTGVDSSGQTTLPASSNSTPSPGLSSLFPSSGSSGGGTSLDSKGNAGNGLSLGGNPLGIAAAGAGLLSNMVSGNKAVPQSPALNSVGASTAGTAAQQTAAGTALQQYVATGTLPQGYEDQVQQAAQSAKSTIISNYANRGLPTDPTKNSALAQELAQVDARLPAAREQLAQSLATTGAGMITTGLQASGIESGVYQTLANLETAQNTARGSAIANFASALNGGNKGVTVNLGKAA